MTMSNIREGVFSRANQSSYCSQKFCETPTHYDSTVGVYARNRVVDYCTAFESLVLHSKTIHKQQTPDSKLMI